jgi:hypothetical protein
VLLLACAAPSAANRSQIGYTLRSRVQLNSTYFAFSVSGLFGYCFADRRDDNRVFVRSGMREAFSGFYTASG